MNKILLSFFIGIGLIFCFPVLATDIYVSETGSDVTGTGTETAPYATVTQALNTTAGGDTIYCQGTLLDSFTITAAHSGVAGAYTTITSWPGYTGTINGNGANYIINVGAGANYIAIDGLSLTNAAQAAIYGNAEAAYWTISNNQIFGLTAGLGAKALAFTSLDHLQITGNIIDGGSNTYYGIDIKAAEQAVVANNSVKNFVYTGITIDDESAGSIIKNNWVYNIGGVDYSYTAGINIADSHDIQVVNNSLYYTYNGAYNVIGIEIMTSSHDLYNVIVKNNIIHSANYAVSLDYLGYTGLEFDHNIYSAAEKIGTISGVDYDTLADWQTTTGLDSNSMTDDPLYVSTTVNSEDLHLPNESPAINAGTLLADVTDDYDGEVRPYSVTDIGADERPVLAAAPNNLSSDPSVKQVTLSWLMDDIYPTTNYNLIYSTESDFFGGITTEYDQNAVATLTGLKPAKKYYAAVQAIYKTDYATYTSDYSEALLFGTKPSRVTKTKNLITVHNYSQWHWKKQRRVFNYAIKLMNADGQMIKTISVKKKKSFVNNVNKKFVKYSLSGLESGKTYMIKIRAKKKINGEWLKGKWSTTKTFRTMADSGPTL